MKHTPPNRAASGVTRLMLCEECQQREAMVHLTGRGGVAANSDETSVDEAFANHFCESCASSSPLVNPALKYGPDVISENFRVVSVSAERTQVRQVRTETEAVPEELSLLTSRLPPQFAVIGIEFGIICSPEELEQLKGRERG